MSLPVAQRLELIELARRSIELGLSLRQRPPCDSATRQTGLGDLRSSFVTLHVGGELRGCCGTLTAARPLAEDVWRNAWASAFDDPRFAPLSRPEWPCARVHISILSSLQRLEVRTERELLAQLRPGIDGLCLTFAGARATFLPAVWDQIPEPALFLQQLKHKAGWPADFWPAGLVVHRYSAQSFGEDE